MRCRRFWLLASLVLATPALACGELVRLALPAGGELRYAWTARPGGAALILLAGGDGHLRLDAQGCAQALRGNSLVRNLERWQAAGWGTALVDAPSGWQDEDGLAGHRASAAHAAEIGAVIGDLRRRGAARIWMAGTSRGAISAANAAARLQGGEAADGLLLSSPVMQGRPGARKPWVAQTVFDLPLEAIRVPVRLLGHQADRCERSPPALLPRLRERLSGAAAVELTLMQGGPEAGGAASLAHCEGGSAHGFAGQDEEMVERLLRPLPPVSR